MSAAASLLRNARREAGVTQVELARRLGVSQAAVARLERPDANPTIDTLDDALWALGHRLTLDAPAHQPGVDESLIRQQIELSPDERIRSLERQAAWMKELMEAGARARGELP